MIATLAASVSLSDGGFLHLVPAHGVRYLSHYLVLHLDFLEVKDIIWQSLA